MSGQLVETIISLSKFNNLIRDRFFYVKFGIKTRTLLENYILILNGSGESVAQYQTACEKVVGSIEDILEMLDYLKYLNLVRLSPLFLGTQKNLLVLKLELTKNINNLPELKTSKVDFKQETKTDEKNVPAKVSKIDPKLNQSKKKILEFIKSSPNTRTKDIINEFNALSDRTVKRNLMDLLRTGLIKKRVDSKAVYYYSSE